jgi:hypothetical protein
VLVTVQVLVSSCGCASFGDSEPPPPIVGSDRAQLLDAAEAAFVRVLGGAERDDTSGRVRCEVSEAWARTTATVVAEAGVAPVAGGFQLTIECSRRVVGRLSSERIGRSFGTLDDDAQEIEPLPDLTRRLTDEARQALAEHAAP